MASLYSRVDETVISSTESFLASLHHLDGCRNVKAKGDKEMSKLSGKVAVVTGASKGIGASIARYLAAEGASVVVNYASSKQAADQIVSEITSQGGKAIAVGANVAQKEEIARLFSETKAAFG